MKRNVKLEEEKRKLEEEISELILQISKAETSGDKDNKLSWTRDDKIAELCRELEKRQAKLKEISKTLGVNGY